jgi:hypothetical protein
VRSLASAVGLDAKEGAKLRREAASAAPVRWIDFRAGAALVHLPIDDATNQNNQTNQEIHFKNVHVGINARSGAGRFPVPSITGREGDSSLDFDETRTAHR